MSCASEGQRGRGDLQGVCCEACCVGEDEKGRQHEDRDQVRFRVGCRRHGYLSFRREATVQTNEFSFSPKPLPSLFSLFPPPPFLSSLSRSPLPPLHISSLDLCLPTPLDMVAAQDAGRMVTRLALRHLAPRDIDCPNSVPTCSGCAAGYSCVGTARYVCFVLLLFCLLQEEPFSLTPPVLRAARPTAHLFFAGQRRRARPPAASRTTTGRAEAAEASTRASLQDRSLRLCSCSRSPSGGRDGIA